LISIGLKTALISKVLKYDKLQEPDGWKVLGYSENEEIPKLLEFLAIGKNKNGFNIE
jgi:hypothetical protein